jgi:hypothetical protein
MKPDPLTDDSELRVCWASGHARIPLFANRERTSYSRKASVRLGVRGSLTPGASHGVSVLWHSPHSYSADMIAGGGGRSRSYVESRAASDMFVLTDERGKWVPETRSVLDLQDRQEMCKGTRGGVATGWNAVQWRKMSFRPSRRSLRSQSAELRRLVYRGVRLPELHNATRSQSAVQDKKQSQEEVEERRALTWPVAQTLLTILSRHFPTLNHILPHP